METASRVTNQALAGMMTRLVGAGASEVTIKWNPSVSPAALPDPLAGASIAGLSSINLLTFIAKPCVDLKHVGLLGTDAGSYPGELVANELRNSDFVTYVAAFGACRETMRPTVEFSLAVERILASGRPEILTCVLDCLAEAHTRDIIPPAGAQSR